MLEEVDKINWKNLGYPHIPRWLEGLTSVDEAIRRRAFHGLAFNVIMEDEQDYEGIEVLSSEIPVRIIPFLIELLASDSMYGRSTLISWLTSLAMYHNRLKNVEVGGILTEEHKTRASKMFDLVRDGAATYRKLLRHNDPDMRQYAGVLLDILGLPSEGP